MENFKKLLFRIWAILLAPFIWYFALVILGTIIPNGGETYPESEEMIPIWVITNGFHTQIVMPQKHDFYDWSTHVPDTLSQFQQHPHVIISWGDKDFYLSYVEPKPMIPTVLNALFIHSDSYLNVNFVGNNIENWKVEKSQIFLPKENYLALVEFVRETFVMNENKHFILKSGGFTYHDFLFEAEPPYHLLYTCNVWTTRALQKADVKVSLWTPFSTGTMFYLP